MRVVTTTIAIIASACALARDTAAQTTAPAADLAPQQEQTLERNKLETDNASLRTWKAKSLDEVIQLRRAGGQLVATTKLETTDETRLIVPGIAGFMKIRPFVLNVGAGQTEGGFSFTLNDLSGPAPSQAITSISLTAGKLTVARDAQQGETTTSVQLIQDPPSPTPDPDAPVCVLYVSRQDGTGQSQDVSFKRTANSFDDLCIKYADDVNKYFRPILRELQLEAGIFAPDKTIAWQALAEDSVIEPAMLEKVNKLATKLDADSYEERQAALAALREVGQPAALILMRADRSAMSPEKQSSIDEFLAPFIQLTADEAKVMRDSPTFLLDVLATDDVELRKLAWERLRAITNTNIDFDPRGEDNERAMAIEKLRASVKK